MENNEKIEIENDQDILSEDSLDLDNDDYNDKDQNEGDKEQGNILQDSNLPMKKYFPNQNLDFGFSIDFYNLRRLEVENLKTIITKDSNHGLTGVKNIGNSCYMSTIIQCLSHSLELVYFFLSKQFEREINEKRQKAISN